jgi:hypothetical protein
MTEDYTPIPEEIYPYEKIPDLGLCKVEGCIYQSAYDSCFCKSHRDKIREEDRTASRAAWLSKQIK